MSSLVCTVCLETLQTKIALSTTCGHIFCSECATLHFTTRPTCPVCRWVQTFNQLIRLFPEYGRVFRGTSSGATLSPDIDLPQKQNPDTLLRIHIDSTGTRFPWTQAGVAPACDLDGSPVFLGLAAFKHGLHPCKIRVEPKGRPVPFVSYDGKEYEHHGATFLLPFDPAAMLWVLACDGQLPRGSRPVEGGYERIDAQKLYHALAVVNGVSIPGKAGENGHMCGANVSFDGGEHLIKSGYEVLCWQD